MKKSAVIFLLMICVGVANAQKVDANKERKYQLKLGGTIRALGFSQPKLRYDRNFSMTIFPGMGPKVFIGTKIRSTHFDFEFLFQPTFSYDQFTFDNTKYSFSYFKTHFIASIFYKRIINEQTDLRLGLGPTYTLPSRLNIAVNDINAGHIDYKYGFGYNTDLNIVFKTESGIDISPGFRLLITKSNKSKIVYDSSLSELNSINLSSLDLYISMFF